MIKNIINIKFIYKIKILKPGLEEQLEEERRQREEAARQRRLEEERKVIFIFKMSTSSLCPNF